MEKKDQTFARFLADYMQKHLELVSETEAIQHLKDSRLLHPRTVDAFVSTGQCRKTVAHKLADYLGIHDPSHYIANIN